MSAVATLVERQTRYLMLIALPDGHRADLVADALAEHIGRLPDQLRRSLTWDQGKEMASHARFSVETGLPVYFCDPRSPWQRARTRTRTGCCASTSPSAETCARSPRTTSTPSPPNSNGRPRQTLGWMKPSEALALALR
jgi:IS30 family transposase